MKSVLLMIGLATFFVGGLRAQDETAPAESQQPAVTQQDEKSLTDTLKETGKEVSRKLNQSQQAKEISAGLLNPIYKLAEYMSVPWFYWASFALLFAGVVSFALQLVLTKLALLARLKFNLAEILSDALGLLISLVGLVLTTQAATQNSDFTANPALVLSSAAVGLVVGFLLFRWGHQLELRAAKANTTQAQQAPVRDRIPM